MSKSHRPIHLLAVAVLSLSPLSACGKSEPAGKEKAAGGEAASASSGDIKVGLITKTETNPFFVKMKEGAQEAAKAQGATLMTASGQLRRRQREPGHRHREHDRRRREGHPHHAERLQGDRPGAWRRRAPRACW